MDSAGPSIVTLTLKNINHPLDKIFGGIPVGSIYLPRISEALPDWGFFI